MRSPRKSVSLVGAGELSRVRERWGSESHQAEDIYVYSLGLCMQVLNFLKNSYKKTIGPSNRSFSSLFNVLSCLSLCIYSIPLNMCTKYLYV